MRKPLGKTSHRLLAALAGLLLASACGPPDPPTEPQTHEPQPTDARDVLFATTTSTQDSGLMDVLIPSFESRTGYRVKMIAVGTGEALAMSDRGDVDVLVTHAPELEERRVATGSLIRRRPVMHNYFVVAGPPRDPAGIQDLGSSLEALRRIAQRGALFLSRGDGSGTHFREQQLWQAAGIDPKGDRYLESGQGMGATLQIASQKDAYVLTDRGTFLALRQHTGLKAWVDEDPALLNRYSVMEVNPERFPRVNAAGARAFSDFLVSPDAQALIGRFGIDRFGEPLFQPGHGAAQPFRG